MRVASRSKSTTITSPGQATSELTRSASMVLHMVKIERKVKDVGFRTILKDDSAKACLGDNELEQISKEAKTVTAQLKQVVGCRSRNRCHDW